jgi:hypothetical protein
MAYVIRCMRCQTRHTLAEPPATEQVLRLVCIGCETIIESWYVPRTQPVSSVVTSTA